MPNLSRYYYHGIRCKSIFNGSSTCWMVHSFPLSIHLLDGSFLHSFNNSSIHPSIHSFLFLLSCWWWWCVVLLAKLFVQISAAKNCLVFQNRVCLCVWGISSFSSASKMLRLRIRMSVFGVNLVHN